MINRLEQQTVFKPSEIQWHADMQKDAWNLYLGSFNRRLITPLLTVWYWSVTVDRQLLKAENYKDDTFHKKHEDPSNHSKTNSIFDIAIPSQSQDR